MVWGCMSAIGPGLICKIECRTNQYVYCETLETKIYGIFSKFGINAFRVMFHQDNDPKRTTKTMKN